MYPMSSSTNAMQVLPQVSAQASFVSLPSELVIKILQFALRRSKPWTLAALSRFHRNHVYDIIYSVVVLGSSEKIGQFDAISRTNSPTLGYVKKLIVVDKHWAQDEHAKISNVISACTALRTLELPTLEFMAYGLSWPTHPDLVEVTALDARRQFGSSGHALRDLKVERLRIAGDPNSFAPFVRPSIVLAGFNNPSTLTHLELSRLANSNQANDAFFVEDLLEILQGCRFPALKVLPVTIVGSGAQESDIWRMVEGIAAMDCRLVLNDSAMPYGDDYKDFDFTRGIELDSRFWAKYGRAEQY